ncbi:hypothetical protein [Marispirochaeta sp.]|uniref:hypothetical protein n=1 Tax=Marispirochaeta sp. TaxID=2038653 RepID=UPI0029C80979|nr:hypothetical protein [Marispirochaeta sp.]
MEIDLTKYLSREFEIAIEGMRDSSLNPHQRMYYMSATFGAISRVLNIDYNKELVLAHLILQTCHQTTMALMNNCLNGSEKSIVFNPILIDSLSDLIEELGENLVAGESIYNQALSIAEVTYSMTGNGHYLFRKDIIKLPSPKNH